MYRGSPHYPVETSWAGGITFFQAGVTPCCSSISTNTTEEVRTLPTFAIRLILIFRTTWCWAPARISFGARDIATPLMTPKVPWTRHLFQPTQPTAFQSFRARSNHAETQSRVLVCRNKTREQLLRRLRCSAERSHGLDSQRSPYCLGRHFTRQPHSYPTRCEHSCSARGIARAC